MNDKFLGEGTRFAEPGKAVTFAMDFDPTKVYAGNYDNNAVYDVYAVYSRVDRLPRKLKKLLKKTGEYFSNRHILAGFENVPWIPENAKVMPLEVIIVPGSRWNQIAIAPEDAAFLEMRAKIVESVTSWYGAAREELDWYHLNNWTRYLTEKIEEPSDNGQEIIYKQIHFDEPGALGAAPAPQLSAALIRDDQAPTD